MVSLLESGSASGSCFFSYWVHWPGWLACSYFPCPCSLSSFPSFLLPLPVIFMMIIYMMIILYTPWHCFSTALESMLLLSPFLVEPARYEGAAMHSSSSRCHLLPLFFFQQGKACSSSVLAIFDCCCGNVIQCTYVCLAVEFCICLHMH